MVTPIPWHQHYKSVYLNDLVTFHYFQMCCCRCFAFFRRLLLFVCEGEGCDFVVEYTQTTFSHVKITGFKICRLCWFLIFSFCFCFSDRFVLFRFMLLLVLLLLLREICFVLYCCWDGKIFCRSFTTYQKNQQWALFSRNSTAEHLFSGN